MKRCALIALILLAGCRAAAPAPAGHTAGRGWSAPARLVAATTPTSAPQVDVAADGSVIAAWYEGRLNVAARLRKPVLEPISSGSVSVIVDIGSTAGGFGQPVKVSATANGAFDALQVAAAGPHLAFVAWSDVGATDVSVAVLKDGRIATVRRIGNAVPVALKAVRGDRVALVWNQFGHGFPFMRYALMDAAGQMTKTTTIVHLGNHDSVDTKISINNSGELAAAWERPGAINYLKRGMPFTPATLYASVCEPAGHCTGRRAVPLGTAKVACINPAVALAPDGTVTVIAAANDPAPHGCAKPLGVWGGTARAGQTLSASTRIAPGGDQPVATPIGPSGALTVFSPGTIPYTTLAWSARTQSGFTRPAPVRDAHTINAPLVASGAGEFIAAWTHSFGFVNAPTEVRAATGTPQTFGTPQTVVPAGGHANTFAAGIDATGDAVIVWNTTTSLRGAVGLQASILR